MATRGSRAGRIVLIIAGVLVVLLVIADRAAAYVAERKAADTLQTSQNLRNKPDVSIDGFPFLTQLASRDFGQVEITAKDVPIGSGSRVLDLSRVAVVLHTLTVSSDLNTVHARTATATATIGLDQLSRVLGVSISYAGNGRIKAAKRLTVAGTTVDAAVTAKPQAAGNALQFADPALVGANPLGNAVVQALAALLGDIPLDGIPFQVRLQSLSVDGQGVHLALTGRDLSYTRRR